ncbi:three-helix bundle dimerization domain-containing protein [Actinomycetospora sp. TBRC 11914]|uniref:three-helix bundle dimerization domain-containing protein n=1 Tax=Actinomycetospora sp. TBRC 11914 TaxID=2729387 RepID=UPI00145DDF6C|nr:hypothetical protein [Actinomycetospora sp. TBRC 11914]NMO89473.1 hypothetical protein [Actinomycetospora sp. TBRC 11914]
MPSATPTVTDESVVSAIERLTTEFAGRSPAPIEPVVTACRRDLAGAPPGALPELVERLARQRLLERRDASRR